MGQDESNSIVTEFSRLLGTSEPALRLLLTLFAGYPLAIIFRNFINVKPTCIQHVFSILCGFSLGYWNYGTDMFHTIFAITLTYLVLWQFGGTTFSVGFVFLFNLLYLLFGYYYVGTDNYDINWTMPQCILVLRLIGVAFDYYDGQQPLETLGSENKKIALKELPTVLEFFGHSLFPSSFMVGPQFPMKRYQNFIKKSEMFSVFNEQNAPDPTNAAVKRLLLGMFYLSVFQVLGFFVYDSLIYSPEFAEQCFFKRLFLMGVWGRFTLYKYISCWLLTEGSCILYGLSYNGKDASEAPIWNGVENVKISTLENTTEFNHYIQSFNINTNHWSAQYIYKRLKFLGNRHVSQIATLLFLAIWHGFHSGYFVCFFFEFSVIYLERDLKSIIASNQKLSNFFAQYSGSVFINILLRLYTFIFMGWCLMPFALLKFERYWAAFSGANHVGSLVFLLWPILYSPLLRMIFKKDVKVRVD